MRQKIQDSADRLDATRRKYEEMTFMMDFNEKTKLELKKIYLDTGTNYFVSRKGNQEKNGLKLVHSLDYKRIKQFVEGVKNDEYQFYDDYPNSKEVVIIGSANSGKSSLINALNNQYDIARTAKRSGKT